MAQITCPLVSAEDRARLEAIVADRNRAQKHVARARIILHSADRLNVAEVAKRVGVGRPAVWRWQRRFALAGVDSLLCDATRKPGKPRLDDAIVRRVVALTHDYKRHGTTTLFAALNVLDGTVVGRCMARHRHQEFLRCLNAIERAVPAGKVIHVILDNYAAHKHPKVLAWLARHPRWTFHFTPTSGSWLNAVETFFSALTRRRLKRSAFRSIVELQAAINRYLAEHNRAPQPFVWTKRAEQILAKLNHLNASVH